jgi:hypothetical protein
LILTINDNRLLINYFRYRLIMTRKVIQIQILNRKAIEFLAPLAENVWEFLDSKRNTGGAALSQNWTVG